VRVQDIAYMRYTGSLVVYLKHTSQPCYPKPLPFVFSSLSFTCGASNTHVNQV